MGEQCLFGSEELFECVVEGVELNVEDVRLVGESEPDSSQGRYFCTCSSLYILEVDYRDLLSEGAYSQP